MDSNLIEAVAALVSAVVISVTALAAFRQLKHYRNANDIVVYFRLIERMDSEATRVARRMLQTLDETIGGDPVLAARQFDSREAIEEIWPVVDLLRFLEHICVLVIKGQIAEELILAEYAEVFLEIWQQARRSIAIRRGSIGPFTGRALEHMAMRAKRYIDGGQMAREYDVLERDATVLDIAP